MNTPLEVRSDGDGAETIVMVHGWPDTLRLWDAQVAALQQRFRCVRPTLPGFDRPQPGYAASLDDVIEALRSVVQQAGGGRPVTLMAHDWGCLYAYQFVMRHPELVSRIVGVDIGDTGSREHRSELRWRDKAFIVGYQLWLATAWRIGGRVGNGMARWMARMIGCPADAQSIHAGMGYPYAATWFGVAGGFKKARRFDPAVPMLYLYGERKPFMFHSQAWADRLALRPGSRVAALRAGHWLMVQRKAEFNDAVLAWLDATAPG